MLQLPSPDSTKLGMLGGIATVLGKLLHSAFRRRNLRLRRLEERVDTIHDNYVGAETLQQYEDRTQTQIAQVNDNVNKVHERIDGIYEILLERKPQ